MAGDGGKGDGDDSDNGGGDDNNGYDKSWAVGEKMDQQGTRRGALGSGSRCARRSSNAADGV